MVMPEIGRAMAGGLRSGSGERRHDRDGRDGVGGPAAASALGREDADAWPDDPPCKSPGPSRPPRPPRTPPAASDRRRTPEQRPSRSAGQGRGFHRRPDRRLDQRRGDQAADGEARAPPPSPRPSVPARGGEPRPQLLPRPREPALDRPDRAAEPLGDLVVTQALDVAEHQWHPISLRQPTDLLVDDRPQLDLLEVATGRGDGSAARRSTIRRRSPRALSLLATRRATP